MKESKKRESIKIIKNGIIILFSLIMPFNVLIAGNGKNIKPIKPLPTLKVISLDENGEGKLKIQKEYVIGEKRKIDMKEEFHFSEVDKLIGKRLENVPVELPPEDNDFASSFMKTLGKAHLSKKVGKAKEICDKAIGIGNFIDKLTGGDLVSMPLVKKQKIGESDVFIIFNSAKIYPQYAEIEVYIKIDMHKKDFWGDEAILYFGAPSIKFSQEKGIIQGVVALIEDYTIALNDNPAAGANAGLLIKKAKRGEQVGGQNTTETFDDVYDYSGTYVLFDCDGFKEMGFQGAIYFSREWMIPTNEWGEPRAIAPKDSSTMAARVTAGFQIQVQDFNDIYLNLEHMDHFVLTKWQKISFFLNDAYLDFSDYRSPEGTPYNLDPGWTGVYIDYIGITMPKQFKRVSSSYSSGSNQSEPQTERIKISAENLLIDEYGVSGKFSVIGQAPLIGGPIMAGQWGYSLDRIELELETSSVTRFEIEGKMGVPILSKKGPLLYSSSYDFEEKQFKFTTTDLGKKEFPIWNAAEVDITAVKLSVIAGENDFEASVQLWGKLEIGNPKDYANSSVGSKLKMPNLEFQNLKISTSDGISCQSLSINNGGNNFMEFPVTITNPSLTTMQNKDIRLGFDITLNLMNEGGGVSATSTLAVIGAYHKDQNWAKRLEYKEFEFLGASIVISLPQFYAAGQICIFEEDPIYGNGFSAKLLAKLIGSDLDQPQNHGKIEISMQGIFGSKEGYRYWFFDAFVGSDKLSIPIVPPDVLTLNGFGGGMFHHMRPVGYDLNMANSSTVQSCGSGPTVDKSGIIYGISNETKLGIKFTTAFSGVNGTISGLVTCMFRFGNNYSLQNITFWGTADLLVSANLGESLVKSITDKIPNVLRTDSELISKREEDLEKEPAAGVKAAVGISFDFENLIFHTFADVRFQMENIITGKGTLDILVDPHGKDDKLRWHFWLGGYSDGSTKAYDFFTGEKDIVPLYPVSVGINYDGFSVSASAYFLLGNDLPGPPPPPAEVAKFFENCGETVEDNRDLLECGGRSPALGSGIAFGASAFFDMAKMGKGWIGCLGGYKVVISTGVGFELALLKYNTDAVCSNGDPIGGINGSRATGRLFFLITLEQGHVTCLPIPKIGTGAMIDFDISKPSYFSGTVFIDFVKHFEFGFESGTQCGIPVNCE
ncbi:MAG: hypothetical protein R2771_02355 [Saprospiraceae bacterium]